MFDGDFNVLLTQIVDSKVDNYVQSEDGTIMRAPGNITVRDLLNSSFQKVMERAAANGDVISLPQKAPGTSLIDQLTEQYPLLQIAVPVLEEQLENEDYIPSVVFLPGEFDEQLTEYLPAVKGDREYAMTAKTEPDSACVVISMNERVRLLDKAPEEPDALTPSAPQNLAAQSTAIGIKLTWIKPTSGTITGYVIFRKGVGEADYSLIQSIYGEDNLHFEDTDVKPQLNYSYYAKAFYEEEDDYPYYIIKGETVVRFMSRVPGQIHYSLPSNYVTANSPALATPGGIKLVYSNARQLDLEWDAQTAYANEYEVWRKSSKVGDSNWKSYTTTAGSYNFFEENGLDAGIYYCYKVRAKTSNGNYSAFSNSIGSSASERNIETPFKLTYLKFKDEAALKMVEPWCKGAPELWLTVAKGDATNSQKVKTIRYEPSSRNASFQNWNYANKIILDNWNPNRDGAVFTFEWFEEDVYFGTYTFEISTSYQNKFSDTETLNVGTKLSITVGYEDDKIGSSIVTWWNPKNTKFNASAFGSEFYWYIE